MSTIVERPDKINYYLDVAETIAERSTCLITHYGAVIVKNDQILSTGYNGAPRGVINCIDDPDGCIRKRFNLPHDIVHDLCLSGNTVIKLLNGSYATIQELADQNRCEWIYSIDTQTGCVVPAYAYNPRRTKIVTSLLRICLDDGGFVDCTPDHRFLMKDLTYKEAGQLLIGDLLFKMKLNNDNRDLTIESFPIIQKEYARGAGKGHNCPRLDTILKFYNTFEEALDAGKNYNHKVIGIYLLNFPYGIWVYDISVQGTSNFAIRTSPGNCIISHNCKSVHSEANAIISASRNDMIDSDLYLVGIDASTGKYKENAMPCKLCKRIIINAGIKRIYVRDDKTNYREYNIIRFINEESFNETVLDDIKKKIDIDSPRA